VAKFESCGDSALKSRRATLGSVKGTAEEATERA